MMRFQLIFIKNAAGNSGRRTTENLIYIVANPPGAMNNEGNLRCKRDCTETIGDCRETIGDCPETVQRL